MPTLEDILGHSDGADNRPVVTGTIVSVDANGATVELLDGRKAILPTGEAPIQQLPDVGTTRQFLELEPGPPVVVSLTHPALVAALLAGVVPEIRSGVIQVKGVSRLPGVRAKVAVASADADIDGVAALVGRAANRVKYLSEKLNGERVDIIAWHEDRQQLLRNAFAPAEITGTLVEGRYAVVSVPPHRMSAAVGRGGLNASLAGRLSGTRVVAVREGEDMAAALDKLKNTPHEAE